MKEYLIGTGGWAYFLVLGLKSLAAYSEVFNFVEVNSIFYQIPPLEEVERWRKTVPSDFQFSVRANRTITHKHRFKPTEEALETFEKMKRVCSMLRASIMHLQAPPQFAKDRVAINNLRDFLSATEPRKLRLAIEIRTKPPSAALSEMLKIMQDHNVIHCVDLSKGEIPAYESDILYTRLFGKGRHNIYQPMDGELAEIDHKVSNSKSEKAIMSFHFVKMYTDATRLKIYKQTGKFPAVTRSTGLSSLEEVLRQDATFPATKQELLYQQGWKLFDLSKNRRVPSRMYLQRLPDKTYSSTHEIAVTLQEEANS